MRTFVRSKDATVASVAEAWRRQYNGAPKLGWYNVYPGDGKERSSELIYMRILACHTLEEVDYVIGNECWTRQWCSVHKAYVTAAVEIDAGDGLVYVCEQCLSAALAELKTRV